MFPTKVIFVFVVVLAVDFAFGAGEVKPLSGERLQEAENILTEGLEKLASGEGPSYKLGKIISATSQVVAGSKYVYEAELIGDDCTKTCTVKIWSRPWLNANEITFSCPDEEDVKTSY